MAWLQGAEIAIQLWRERKDFVPSSKRKKTARKLYDSFCELGVEPEEWPGDSQLEVDAEADYEL